MALCWLSELVELQRHFEVKHSCEDTYYWTVNVQFIYFKIRYSVAKC